MIAVVSSESCETSTLYFLFISRASVACFKRRSKCEIAGSWCCIAAYALLMLCALGNTTYRVIAEHGGGVMGAFALFTAGVHLLTLLLHAEWRPAVGALVAFFFLPLTSVLLPVDALFHLSDVAWGTRDEPPEASEDPADDRVFLASASDDTPFAPVSALLPQETTPPSVRRFHLSAAVLMAGVTVLYGGAVAALLVVDAFVPLRLLGTHVSVLLAPAALVGLHLLLQLAAMAWHGARDSARSFSRPATA